MRSLVRDLLDMTQIDSETLSVTPEPVDVATLVEVAGTAFLRGGTVNSIEVDIPPDLPTSSTSLTSATAWRGERLRRRRRSRDRRGVMRAEAPRPKAPATVAGASEPLHR